MCFFTVYALLLNFLPLFFNKDFAVKVILITDCYYCFLLVTALFVNLSVSLYPFGDYPAIFSLLILGFYIIKWFYDFYISYSICYCIYYLFHRLICKLHKKGTYISTFPNVCSPSSSAIRSPSTLGYSL